MYATYSPEDNKLRLYSDHRLGAEDYARVKGAGFKWAPQQKLFVAPMWTPYREDVLIQMCGEIGDEDTSLVDRAEERAERFEGYSENRAADAERARAAVSRIADNIPLGQPILVGHHSERHARRDAERIENGMRKTIKMWETSKYWEQRAAGALRHAKYKELPAVRYRRIKGLEADLRKENKSRQEADMWLKLWIQCSKEENKELQRDVALRLAGMCRVLMPRKEGDRPEFDQKPDIYSALTGSYPTLYAPRTLEEVLEAVLSPDVFPRQIVNAERWIAHLTNRIAYERAMIGEQGGLKGESFDYEPGGRVLRRGQWYPILKVNKRGGVFRSVTVSGHFATTISADEIKDYLPPKEGEAEKVKAAMKLPPMCNYPGEGFKHMTTDEWKRKKMSDVSQSQRHAATDKHGEHRTRSTYGGNWKTVNVYLTDSKRIDPPAAPLVKPEPIKFEKMMEVPKRVEPKLIEEKAANAIHADMEAMREALRTGVKVVSAPQLFPTPEHIADRMVKLADIKPGQRVLEPSAGTGRIVDAIRRNAHGYAITAVELNCNLAHHIRTVASVDDTHQADFLECNGNLGKFDRILMNPPFRNGEDIKHITHALKMLNPGGRIVAICANGPRQNERLKPIADARGGLWEELPPDTFSDAGTGVRTVLLTIDHAQEPTDVLAIGAGDQ